MAGEINMQERMSAAEYRQLMGVDMPDFKGDPVEKKAMKKPKKPRKTEEDDLTMQVADYCELLMAQGKVVCFSHIPQETFTKHWAVKNKNKAMGVRPGVPDMLIVFVDRILFLELKRLKGGVVSPDQKHWIDSINKIAEGTAYAQGKSQVIAAVAAGWNQAKLVIDDCLPD